jgi:outer membrane protein OmpA-like peptidoglycan-associated protein
MKSSAVLFLFFLTAIALAAQGVVVERSVPAFQIADRVPITLTFRGTTGQGNAIVENKDGMVRVSADFKGLPAPGSFGSEDLAYVLWAISPDRAAVSLGQLVREGDRAKIEADCQLETFGLVVTAERDPSVKRPSGQVVLESMTPPGMESVAEARYEVEQADAAQLESAVERVSEKREQFVDERAAALAREKSADASAESARDKDKTLDRERAEREAYTAGRERSVAEALAAVEQFKLEQLGAAEVEPWSPDQMVAELNKILQTRAIKQQLVINASSLFFDEGYALKAFADDKFMEIAGILRGRPELKIEVDAHISGTGSAEGDQRLSSNLANAVREFLIDRGLDPRSISAHDSAAAALEGVKENEKTKSLEIVISADKSRRVSISPGCMALRAEGFPLVY